MKRPTIIVAILLIVLSVTNLVTYLEWKAQSDAIASNDARTEQAHAYTNAVKDARFAVQMGDYRLYEPVDSKDKLQPVRREGKFVVHSVSLDQFLEGTRAYWRWYFDMYNTKVRRDADLADSPDQQVFKAIQAARLRGEWSGEATPNLEENRWDIEETIRKKTQANP